MLSPLENLRALREALLDERDVIELKSRPVDENPLVVAKLPTRRWKPFIRSVWFGFFILLFSIFIFIALSLLLHARYCQINQS